MPKRFTATEKWQDAWFRSLTAADKLLWIYILDNCDYAGLWEYDLGLASFYTGFQYEPSSVVHTFGTRVIQVDTSKLFIPKFIEFQYGNLSQKVKPHQAVIKRLRKYGLLNGSLTLTLPLPKGRHTPKDKDKEKDKAKEKLQRKGTIYP